MKRDETDRFQTQYMSAQNVHHHEHVAARTAELLRRSRALVERAREARSRSEAIRDTLHKAFPGRRWREPGLPIPS